MKEVFNFAKLNNLIDCGSIFEENIANNFEDFIEEYVFKWAYKTNYRLRSDLSDEEKIALKEIRTYFFRHIKLNKMVIDFNMIHISESILESYGIYKDIGKLTNTLKKVYRLFKLYEIIFSKQDFDILLKNQRKKDSDLLSYCLKQYELLTVEEKKKMYLEDYMVEFLEKDSFLAKFHQ